MDGWMDEWIDWWTKAEWSWVYDLICFMLQDPSSDYA